MSAMSTRRRAFALLAALFLLACGAPAGGVGDGAGAVAGSPETPMPESSTPNDFLPPAAAPYDDALRARLAEALDAKGGAYEPRTHHLLEDGRPRFVNRLILEDSPYLLQHAHNPVDWHPWGEEAFARAKREGKPVFLSIGYSTCHWCHVMERESFEDVEIARYLNEHFIAIKIDREQRPDIDEIYMTAVQLISGRGGWPMSSFLTPEGKPFYAGTYFPPGQFRGLLGKIVEAWSTQREVLVEDAENLSARVRQITAAKGEAAEVGAEAIESTVGRILSRHDSSLGGFGGAPKFPNEPDLLFLLQQVERGRHPEGVAALTKTLDAMARGGIYDQVGGGFHRYSVDAEWLVPHFEKMLYNQAHLARVYAAGFALTGDPFYARVARQILSYVRREMTSPEEMFYSATDADSLGEDGESEEGLFFVWTPEQLRAVLGAEDAELASDLFGVTEAGNFEGRNILHLPVALDEYAASREMPLETLLGRVDRIRETLRRARETRPHPLRDDKILTAWNGMMITALAEGYDVLGDIADLDAARRAADRLWEVNHRRDGALWRVHLDGRSSVPALQEDYAYFVEALLALDVVDGDPRWLERARLVTAKMIELFWDAENGGFFMSAAGDDPLLLTRPKSPTDGAVPSGNSVALRVLARLAERTGDREPAVKAEATVSAFASLLLRYPAGFSYFLMGVDDLLHGSAGRRAWGAAGKVAATARLEGGDGPPRARITLKIAEGWHINSREPLQEELIPTALAVEEGGGWRLGEVVYPDAETVRLGFQDEPLSVYQGEIEFVAEIDRGAVGDLGVVPLRLRVQACDDQVCLRPETLEIELPVAAALR